MCFLRKGMEGGKSLWWCDTFLTTGTTFLSLDFVRSCLLLLLFMFMFDVRYFTV